jgi:hypothetical protein
MTGLCKPKLVAFKPVIKNDPVAVRRRKRAVKSDDEI